MKFAADYKKGILTIQSADYIEDGWYIQYVNQLWYVYEIPQHGGAADLIAHFGSFDLAYMCAKSLT